MGMRAYRGSHLPVLMKLVPATTGPILEMGCGHFSTIYLHWACFPTKRRLVTYENNPTYYGFAKLFEADFHEIHCVTDWDAQDICSEQWSIAFLDHEPPQRRGIELRRLINNADYIVAHDAGRSRRNRKFGFGGVHDLFKYSYDYEVTWPPTSVWSNKYDLSKFDVK